ncbi:CRISPR-associated endonuclease Cas3'' [Psychrosphaera algicola]|uniref:CRISPR-associated endonuclease Cas3 n=1 Tax=Psychrosphaera algicola TaxID=3023714 RepID=A0ABT5FBW8_9GAMM|nr:CRISPR-associated endonuclease Cas3'' [Psychrosphaera sp. G1-22]MDC2888534.1 CRISPR-associated endonuclease Cas3'' [Psychrosphaera sp. G1-22]
MPYHCMDVAAVGKVLLAEDKLLTKDLAAFLEVTPKQLQSLLVFLLALHDLGKFASAFQKLYSTPNGELLKIESCFDYDGKNYRHDRMGLYFWNSLLEDFFTVVLGIDGYNRRTHADTSKNLMVLMNCMLGHHGEPINKQDPQSIKAFTEDQNLIAIREFYQELIEVLKLEFPIEKLAIKAWRRKLELVSWQIAGIAVLADWIGSDRYFFTYKSSPGSLNEYWQLTQQIAIKAVNSTDLDKAPLVKPFISIKEHFGYIATPLQQWAETVELDNSPQLFILEDVTGAGKTEAALALTHRLMATGSADGFYFGLPTMATSNAMFSRVAKHYLEMLDSTSDKQPSIVLAHGAREMNNVFSNAVRDAKFTSTYEDQNYDNTDSTATAQCNQWLADSRKKLY